MNPLATQDRGEFRKRLALNQKAQLIFSQISFARYIKCKKGLRISVEQATDGGKQTAYAAVR